MSETKSLLSPILSTTARVATYLVLVVALYFFCRPAVEILGLPAPLNRFNFAITGLLAGLGANWICMRLFEGAGLPQIGLTWSGRNLGIGLAAGVSSALLVTVAPVMVGAAEFKSIPGPSPAPYLVLGFAAVFLAAAASEEIQFRGFLLQVLMRTTGLIPAAILTSLLFTSGHALNPHASQLGMVNTFLAGFALACAFRASGDLWFPLGIHFGWNVWLAITGADVSGFAARMTNIEMVWKAGPLWSGGEYGPEGGILTTGAFGLWLLWAWKAPIKRQLPWMLKPSISE
ncbi:MAG: type II CAAX endopeptidase family protein [Bryobacteraceae bacterium]